MCGLFSSVLLVERHLGLLAKAQQGPTKACGTSFQTTGHSAGVTWQPLSHQGNKQVTGKEEEEGPRSSSWEAGMSRKQV